MHDSLLVSPNAASRQEVFQVSIERSAGNEDSKDGRRRLLSLAFQFGLSTKEIAVRTVQKVFSDGLLRVSFTTERRLVKWISEKRNFMFAAFAGTWDGRYPVVEFERHGRQRGFETHSGIGVGYI